MYKMNKKELEEIKDKLIDLNQKSNAIQQMRSELYLKLKHANTYLDSIKKSAKYYLNSPNEKHR